MRRLLLLVLTCVLLLPTACESPSGPGNAASQEDAAARDSFKQWLRTALKEDPSLILEVLSEHNEELLHIVEAGLRVSQEKALKAQRLSQLKQGNLPVIDDARPSFGPANATLTVVEFSDFQCPYCSQAARTLELLQKKYADSMRVYFKHMPLSSHQHAQAAAAVFEAASMQDEAKAWELYHRFFQGQDQIKDGGVDWLMAQAQEVGLDLDRLKRDAGSTQVLGRIKEDLQEAQRFGLQGTPSFVINGVTASGAMSLEEFIEIVEFVRTNDPRLNPEAANATATGIASGTNATAQ
ncbi:DsbA family protein [Megalodesulfovibrio paquesii]